MNTIAELRPGMLLGRYEILAPIAQGGMAAVWAARQWGSRGFTKIVAIKTMLPSISDDPRFERMFLDEARIASRIHHDHVVEILDLGEQNTVLYLVMEWVDGQSLSTIRRAAASQGGIPVAVAVRIVADSCSGLHAAHELCDDEGVSFGLVHRDVSPQNILVGHDGGVKILDFGVAKVAGRASDTTNAGHARGKPPYMAPEQALGQAIDRRADIFSLGIVLYQLVSDRHPFRGENDIATLHNIVSDTPVISPRAFAPNLSVELERVMLRALERNPDKRFQTAQEMELELESLLDSDLGRVRHEEIGRLVSKWLGARGEERRQALREAIRRADTAEATPGGGGGRGSRPSLTSELGQLAGTPARLRERAGSHPAMTPVEELEPLDGRTGRTVVDPRAPGSARHAQSGDSDDGALTEHGVHSDLVDSSASESTRGPGVRGRLAKNSRTVLVVALAMMVGAVAAWSALGFRTRHSSESRQTLSTQATGTATAAAPKVTTDVVAPGSSQMSDTRVDPVPAGDRGGATSAITAVPEYRPAREPKSTSGRTKRRADVPKYQLPPIASPGF